jgi:pSer/pThr/pTyr-binding forkhead associated (FHA) protein
MEAVLLSPSGRTVLESAVVTIGRTADNQFVVNDASVSSHHAEMRLLVQGYSIIDLSSANGTFVNEQRLDSDVPCLLNAGDLIRLGDATFRYAVSDVSNVTSGVSATLI